LRYSQLPWQPKLWTNAAQANLDGKKMWRFENCRMLPDGSIQKRYGTTPWSKYVLSKFPTDPTRLAQDHHFTLSGAWDGLSTYDQKSLGQIALVNSIMRVYMAPGGGGQSATHPQQNSSIVLNDEGLVSLRFRARFEDVPSAIYGSFSDDYFIIELCITGTRGIRLIFTDDGVYTTRFSGNALFSNTASLIDGHWHTWEATMELGSATINLYRDEVLVGTSVGGICTSMTDGRVAVLARTVNNVTEAHIDYIGVASGLSVSSTVWQPDTVRGIFEYKNSVQQDARVGKRHLLAHAGGSVFVDKYLDGRPYEIRDDLRSKTGIPNYCVFRDRVYFTDSEDLRLMSWNTIGSADLHPTAPQCSLIAPYSARLWASGDPNNPLRTYFSGIRNANDWTVGGSGSFITSGYLDLEEHQGGDRIVAMHGPWQGLLVFETEKTVQVVDATGGDPNTFSRRTIVYGLGGVSGNGSVVVGNDFYYLSKRGIHELNTTQKFGSIETAFLSFAIDNLWSPTDWTDTTIMQSKLQNAWAGMHRPESWAIWCVPVGISSTNGYWLIYDYRLQAWYIWNIAATSITEFTAPDESASYLLYGGYDGYMNLCASHLINDNGTDFTQTVETARLDFKDYPDPQVQLRDVQKRFKSLHLHLRPLNTSYSVAVTVQTDEVEAQSHTISHDPFRQASLGNNFLIGPLGTSKLQSPERVAVVSTPIDCHGKYLRVTLSQSTGNLCLHGFEVEFESEGSPRGYT
jgi:hypothetical protein